MNFSKIFKKFRILRFLPWSIRFNFHYLPFMQAVKLPIIFYVRPTFLALKGEVRLPEKCRFGMIKLGKDIAPIVPCREFRWQVSGTVVFIGGGVISHHSFISVGKGSYLEFGNKVSFSYGATIICFNKIVMGTNFRVSWRCTLIDTDFHPLIDMVSGKEMKYTAPIIFGGGCWLGHDCIVSKGVHLADNITVSSGSVVKGRFKKCNTIIGGNPAVQIDEGYVRDDCREISSR